MLLDEPFSGLDTQLREDVRNTTLEVLKAAGVATLMVTHDPGEALVAGDVISVISGGRILQTGGPSEIYGRPASRAVAEVFGQVNCWQGVVGGGVVQSPLGSFAAPELADSCEAEILIRPESLRLRRQSDSAANPAGVSAKVIGVVIEGGTARLTVELADGSTVLEARDLSRHGWQAGDEVFVDLAVDAVVVNALH